MSLLFDRKVSVTIGVPGQAGVKITSLRTNFNIVKNLETSPNTCKITIYNLNPDNRALLQKENLTASIEAGYVDTSEVIFSGDVQKPITKKEGADYISSIEIGDGQTATKEKRVNKTYATGSTAQQVIDDLKSILDIDEGFTVPIPHVTYLKGLTLSGLVKDKLTEITKKLGLEWSIQNGALQIIVKGGTSYNTLISISQSTGLIGTPQKTDNKIEVVSLLQPKLIPGRLFSVTSEVFDGQLKIEKVTHVGDTHGADWYSKIEASTA